MTLKMYGVYYDPYGEDSYECNRTKQKTFASRRKFHLPVPEHVVSFGTNMSDNVSNQL